MKVPKKQPKLRNRNLNLIVGLGNPGENYAQTRHNVGFEVIERIAEKLGCRFDEIRRFKALIAKNTERTLILAKPLTYMNLSGFSVSAVVNFYKIELENLLVISDDLDLEAGKIRFQNGGSSAGHKGVESIINQLGSKEFVRLRVGIGKQDNVVSYVLGRFREDELRFFDNIFERAAEAALYWNEYKFDKAANRYNGMKPLNS